MATLALTLQDREHFIHSLALPAVPSKLRALGLAATVRGEKQGAFVDAGSIISFVAGISENRQRYTLKSVLLAQLAADNKFDRAAKTEDWYKYYNDVLEHIGWVTQAQRWKTYDAHGKDLDVDKAVLEILTAVATQNELAAITAAINGAKSLADGDGRITLFDHFVANAEAGAFQLGAASEQGGAVALRLGSFRYTSKSTITKVLWFKFSTRDTKLDYSQQEITLTAALYDAVRTTVETKLKDQADKFLADLDVHAP